MSETTNLILPVTFDPDRTDAESVAAAVDRLLETALSTPGILDEYGKVTIGETQLPAENPMEVPVTASDEVLARIGQAYLDNNLDAEARRFWGRNLENENTRPPEEIILYSGRGGKTLLTLADCLNALKRKK